MGCESDVVNNKSRPHQPMRKAMVDGAWKSLFVLFIWLKVAHIRCRLWHCAHPRAVLPLKGGSIARTCDATYAALTHIPVRCSWTQKGDRSRSSGSIVPSLWNRSPRFRWMEPVRLIGLSTLFDGNSSLQKFSGIRKGDRPILYIAARKRGHSGYLTASYRLFIRVYQVGVFVKIWLPDHPL